MTFNTIEQIALFAMLLLSIGSFSYEIFKRFVIVSKGTGSFEFNSLGIRIKRVIVEFVLQKKVISQRFWPGLMHAFVSVSYTHLTLPTILLV